MIWDDPHQTGGSRQPSPVAWLPGLDPMAVCSGRKCECDGDSCRCSGSFLADPEGPERLDASPGCLVEVEGCALPQIRYVMWWRVESLHGSAASSCSYGLKWCFFFFFTKKLYSLHHNHDLLDYWVLKSADIHQRMKKYYKASRAFWKWMFCFPEPVMRSLFSSDLIFFLHMMVEKIFPYI